MFGGVWQGEGVDWAEFAFGVVTRSLFEILMTISMQLITWYENGCVNNHTNAADAAELERQRSEMRRMYFLAQSNNAKQVTTTTES